MFYFRAWKDPSSRETFYADACAQKHAILRMEKEFGPVIVGEWSLATDNCALWLNGFNDNLPGFPRLPCKYIPCADPYMGFDQPVSFCVVVVVVVEETNLHAAYWYLHSYFMWDYRDWMATKHAFVLPTSYRIL